MNHKPSPTTLGTQEEKVIFEFRVIPKCSVKGCLGERRATAYRSNENRAAGQEQTLPVAGVEGMQAWVFNSSYAPVL